MFISVHAFLQDEDFVVDKIDSTTAEEKCLMLIKKPKSSSKKVHFILSYVVNRGLYGFKFDIQICRVLRLCFEEMCDMRLIDLMIYI